MRETVRSRRGAPASAAALAIVMATSVAGAQEYQPSVSVAGASGIEGAGGDVRRARTRLRLGLELRVDEMPDDGVAFAGLVDLEPHAAFGAELRYSHSVGRTFTFGGGGVAYVAPGTLLGPSFGIEAKIPMAKKVYLVAGPEVVVFVLGSDLPNNTVVWQTLLQVGFRADLF